MHPTNARTTPPRRGQRYVAATQSLLVLCTVGAALVPAATLISLDVVKQNPSAQARGTGHGPLEPAGALAAYTKAALKPSLVSTAPVDPTVHEITLTSLPAMPKGIAGGGAAGDARLRARVGAVSAAPRATTASALAHPTAATTVVTSTPQPVVGYGTVGLTWASGHFLPESAVSAQIRWEKDGVWSDWKKMEYHDDHGPDPDSAEAKHERPGTMESLVGHVDEVQTRLSVTGAPMPPDVELAVIDPGKDTSTAVEPAAIDTSRIDHDTTTAPDTMSAPVAGEVGGVKTSAIPRQQSDQQAGQQGGSAPAAPAGGSGSGTAAASDGADDIAGLSADTTPIATGGEVTGDTEQAVLAAAAYTPRPQIYSRAQWGADESLRDKPSLHYFEIHGGFVHHTVNANDYTRAEVPAIIRSIYAYHVKSRGWSDIGYNFLIDRFGRIWEGRYGGVDRPVVGAHTENYNDWSFGVSAIGNYDIAKPSDALIQAEGAIFAWKLSLHGVSAAATNVKIGPRVFASSIMGHRDTKQTACPGRYLYARIPDIRKIAAGLQAGWAARGLQHNLAGASYPDLIVRNATTKMGYVIPTGGQISFKAPVAAASGVPTSTTAFVSPDLTGDGRADLVERAADGSVAVRRGISTAVFGAESKAVRTKASVFAGTTLLAPAGDLNGDGRADLIARSTTTGMPVLLRGNGKGGFTRLALSGPSLASYNLLTATGDVTGDGKNDVLARDASGNLVILPGDGKGHLGAAVKVSGGWGAYSSISGFGDYTGDGHPDLLVRSASTKVSVVRPSNGAGSFLPAVGRIAMTQPYGAVIGGAQMVAGAAPDLVVRTGGTVSVLPNTGRVPLGRPIATGINFSTATQLLNVGDWNGDGHGDIVAKRTDGTLWLYLGNGNGHFQAPGRLATGFGAVTSLAAVGDVTGDGIPDLQGRKSQGAVYIWPGRRPNALATPYASHSGITGQQIGVGTWTTDGAPDSIYRLGSKLTLYPGNGPGGLTAGAQSVVTSTLGNYKVGWVIGVGQLSGPNSRDALLVRDNSGRLYSLVREKSGQLANPSFLGTGLGRYDLVG